MRALDELLKMNAFGLLPLACASPFFFFSLAFFFFAFAPARGGAVLLRRRHRVHGDRARPPLRDERRCREDAASRRLATRRALGACAEAARLATARLDEDPDGLSRQ